MKPYRLFTKILLFPIVIVSLLLFFSYPYFLKKLGNFLIYEQTLQKADVIVVLNGRDIERSLAAVDLFERGYANLIVMGRGSEQPGSDEFCKRVSKNFDRRIFFQRAVEAMGVPRKSFKLIGDGVTSTYDEVLTTKKFLKENGYKSLLLVTSKWHSKRAYLVFRSAFKDDHEIKITIHPSKYDYFDADAWWIRKNDAELVFKEYAKLVYYIFTKRISLVSLI